MPLEAFRQKISFEVVMHGGGGVGKEQIPSALGAQKVALRMVINERRQDPPQRNVLMNATIGEDLRAAAVSSRSPLSQGLSNPVTGRRQEKQIHFILSKHCEGMKRLVV